MKTCRLFFNIFLFFQLSFVTSFNINDINLPPDHLHYYFNEFPAVAETCLNDEKCEYKQYIGRKGCWGYEQGCNMSTSYHVRPRCPGDHRGWVKTKEAQYDTFYTQADFGTYTRYDDITYIIIIKNNSKSIILIFRLCKRAER